MSSACFAAFTRVSLSIRVENDFLIKICDNSTTYLMWVVCVFLIIWKSKCEFSVVLVKMASFHTAKGM